MPVSIVANDALSVSTYLVLKLNRLLDPLNIASIKPDSDYKIIVFNNSSITLTIQQSGMPGRRSTGLPVDSFKRVKFEMNLDPVLGKIPKELDSQVIKTSKLFGFNANNSISGNSLVNCFYNMNGQITLIKQYFQDKERALIAEAQEIEQATIAFNNRIKQRKAHAEARSEIFHNLKETLEKNNFHITSACQDEYINILVNNNYNLRLEAHHNGVVLAEMSINKIIKPSDLNVLINKLSNV